MSDDVQKDADGAAEPDGTAPSEAPTAAATPTPSPRPRSAASRARRIGGGAASPRPEAAASTATASTTKGSGTASTTKGSDIEAPAVTLGKKDGPAPKRSRKPATDEPDEELGRTRGAVTVSLPGWARWAPSFVFAAVAVVFLTLFAVAHLRGDDAPASTSSTMRDKVLASAKTCLATLNTYRYDQIDAAEKAGVACTTGKLTSDYRATVTSVIRKNAPPLKAVQVAKINTAGIESVTKNGKQWTVLAYGQLNITTVNSGKAGRQDPFAVVARLQQVKGKWVLSKIDTVSSASG